MASILTQALGFVLSNYADAIEGGNSHRGSGTSYKGIAGGHSHDPEADGDLAITATSVTGKVTVGYSSGDWPQARWVKTYTPGFFLLCTSATSSENVDVARRITAWDNTAKTFTVDAFPENLAISDVFDVLQGFKRLPDNVDINDEDVGSEGGFDRMFDIIASAGSRQPWYGNNTEQYKTVMEIRLRLEKKNRRQRILASAFDNMMKFRSILTRSAHRDGTYAQLLEAEESEPEIITEDKTKIVIADRYGLTYRVNASFL